MLLEKLLKNVDVLNLSDFKWYFVPFQVNAVKEPILKCIHFWSHCASKL